MLLAPAVVVLHELGHALTARAGGFRVTSFGIGWGRPLMQLRLRGGVVFWVGRVPFGGGACVAVPRTLARGRRAVLFHGGGLMAQALLGLVLLALPEWEWCGLLSRFNAVVALWNLFPWRVGGHASDGWWMLAALGAQVGAGGGSVGTMAQLDRLEAFEAARDSPVGSWYAGLIRAWLRLQRGEVGRAGSFLSQDHVAAVHEPGLEVLHRYVLARWHLACGRPLPALQALKQLREAHGPVLPEEAQDLMALGLARVWLALGEPAKASAELSWLAGVAGPVGQDALVAGLELAVFHTQNGSGDPAQLAHAAARVVHRARSGGLEPRWTAGVLRTAAGLLDPPHQANLGAHCLRLAGRLEARMGGTLSPARAAASPR